MPPKKPVPQNPFPENTEAKEPEAKESPKPKYPVVKRAQSIEFYPEGNTSRPQMAISKGPATSSGRMNMLVYPESGGELTSKSSIPHISDLEKTENATVRKNGFWGIQG